MVNSLRAFRLLTVSAICFVGVPGNAYCRGTAKDVAIAHLDNGDTPQKFENGFQIFWRDAESPDRPQMIESDPDATVRIFKGAKTQKAICRVFPTIVQDDPAVTAVSIYDVSAREPGFIAVAATYARANGKPVAVLLYFDWDGSLLRKVVFDDLMEIEALEIDEAGHVWTLNELDPEDSDDPTPSIFSEYSSTGSLMKHWLKPLPDWSTEEGPSVGQTSFGLTSNQVWAWLPKPRTLIVLDKESGKTTIHKAGLPSVTQNSEIQEARRAVLLPDGQLLMDVGWWTQTQNRFNFGWFLWSSSSGWKSIQDTSNLPWRYLYGMDRSEVIFNAPSGFQSEPLSSLLASISERSSNQ